MLSYNFISDKPQRCFGVSRTLVPCWYTITSTDTLITDVTSAQIGIFISLVDWPVIDNKQSETSQPLYIIDKYQDKHR